MMDRNYGNWLSNPLNGEEVVISGISGLYPESDNVYEFRDNLFNKRDMVTDDERRWKINHPEIPTRHGKINNIDKFDGGYFGVHYRQAENMDPMIRKSLELATEAVMDAGINPSELKGSRTGVFLGTCHSDVECLFLTRTTRRQTFILTGYSRFFMANRISYYFKLKGPSIIIDTACSSSLNALELAFRAIRNGQCENAIVGGANILMDPRTTLQFARLGVLSMDGICKVFDQDANGYVRSDAIIFLLLQKAKCARRIYSQIVHAKVNGDGFKPEGITFPSTQMQRKLITDVLDESRIDPSDVSFLEAHGTGTAVGDPQELEAIDRALADKRSKALLIGSVKCNIGHTEPASGLCSLTKVIIAFDTGLIAPNIYLNKVRDTDGFKEGRLRVVTELTEVEEENATVGINNFGFGGNNCHILLRRFGRKKVESLEKQDEIPKLVCVSGRTEYSVLHFLDDLKEKPLDNEYVGLLHQLFNNNHREHLYRGYAILSTKSSFSSSAKLVERQPDLYVFFGEFKTSFSALGRYLLNFPVFKSTLRRINDYLESTNINIFDVILNNQMSNGYLTLAEIAVQLGIVDLMKLLEINPKAVYGDSLGHLAADYYYEKITLQEAILTAIRIFHMLETDAKRNKIDSNSESHTIIQKILSEVKQSYKKNFNDSHEEYSDYKNLSCLPKNRIILNVSDKCLSNEDLLLTNGNIITFLDTLGRLYLKGFNPRLYKLYPAIKYPVSRNTPMISPLIKWNHKKHWKTYRFKTFGDSDNKIMGFNLATTLQEYKYDSGHVIDGRNLVPATEYLHFVWRTFAHSQKLLISDAPVIFEDCKFHRFLTIPKNDYVNVLVFIQEGSGKFEIVEKDSVVVSGRISSLAQANYSTVDLPPASLDEADKTLVIEEDEIYRELYLRGYGYSGLFKGIVRCNVDVSAGLIRWEDNWTTFMDKMLQMRVLQTDSRLLFIPVGIERMVIDPVKHLSLIDKTTNLVPVKVCSENNVIKSGGIEISGLHAKSISRKKPSLEPILEKHEFVANDAQLKLTEAIRVNIQIILENSMETNFKAVELIDNFTKTDSELLMPIVYKVLEDVPLVKPDLTISTKNQLQHISHINVDDIRLTVNSNLILILGTNILRRPNLDSILIALNKNGYILSREDTNFNPEDNKNVEIMTQYSTQNEKLILFRRKESLENVKCIEISSDDFDWLSRVQTALKSDSKIIVYSQYQELSGILGLTNCLRREPEGSKVSCFFMTDKAPEFDSTIPFYQNQIKKNLAVNIYKDSQWGTYRHLLLGDKDKEVKGDCFYVDTIPSRNLSNLKWIKGSLTPQTQLHENEFIVYSYYSSINFKDVMLASGRIPVEVFSTRRHEQNSMLGLEFAGRDASGRRVVGLVKRSALATHVVADKSLFWFVPENWTLEEAATFPAVYSTVIYALLWTITLKPGMSILIHSATGGVGFAAINLCLYYKCVIFVTVGTSEKKEYLRRHYPQIPESHIGNSRDTSFELMIKTETNGRGVDIVLNSLTEDKLIASVRCLARRGSLLEIGKFDLANDSSLNLLLLEKEITYCGVMLDQLLKTTGEGKNWLKEEIYKGLRLGYVKPLPTTVFQRDEIEKAFRYMMSGKHMGKILIKIRDEEEEKVIKPSELHLTGTPGFHCDPAKCYIIIGGLGGFGMELADWLVLKGARNLVLVSTSGIKTGYQTQRIGFWKSYGTDVQISMVDVTTKEGCKRLLQESSKRCPIDGIFNLAVVLKDALFEEQTQENFRVCLSPKAVATKYIDEVTRELYPNLRYFVVFSSVSCGRGNVGQTNYGMANSVTERICEKRRRDGLPALAIQWGAIGEVGLVARMQKENKKLVIGGTLPQNISSCLQVLDVFLNQEKPIVSSMIVAEKHSKLMSSLTEAIAYALGIKDLETINPNATLTELGMDSVVGTEIIQMLEKDYDIYVPAKEIRSLTFAKIRELETEKNITTAEKSKTDNVYASMMLQNIPQGEMNRVPIIELSNLANDEANVPKIFVISGIEGTFKPLEFITSNLKGHVFALQYNQEHPRNTIEDIAKSMLPHVEERLKRDINFCVIGYSVGAVVALELMALLESRGYNGLVILIEGSPTYLSTAAKLNNLYKRDADFETMVLINILFLLMSADTVLKEKNQFSKCTNFEDRLNLTFSLIFKYANDAVIDRESVIAIYKRFKSVIVYSLANKIKSFTYLFKAKRPMVSNMADDYNLSECCEKPVKVTEVEGDHITILNKPEVVEEINMLLQSMEVY